MRWTYALVALALVLVAAPVTSQTRPGGSRPIIDEFPFKWWQAERFKTELGLTTEQVGRIEAVFEASLPKLRTCNGDLERLESRLSDLIASGTVSEAEVIRQIDLVEAARSEMSKTRTLMLFRMRQVLTPDQRTKMKAMHEQWERERRRPPR